MILQCDQCNTKFRLDDSKLKPGGVKVRCSKCRHVFLAGAELKQEESEFDAILSGLGAQAPEKGGEGAPVSREAAGFGFDEEPAPASGESSGGGFGEGGFGEPAAPAPAAAKPEASGFDDFDFPADEFSAEPGAPEPKQAPAAEEQPDFGDFDFAPEPVAKQEAEAAAVSQGLDYGDFAFDEEPAGLKEEPESAPDASFDLGEFPLSADPAAKAEVPAAAAPGELAFDDFDFDAEPAVTPREPAPKSDALDFGEFSFSEEPAAVPEEPPAARESMDYGDFSFTEEPAAKTEEPSAANEAVDYGDFSFTEEPELKAEEPSTAAKEEPDFGDFSFTEEPEVKTAKPSIAAKEEPDFGEFSFTEEPRAKEEPPVAAEEALDFGEFSFAEEPPLIKETPAAETFDDFGSFEFSEEPLQKQGEQAAPSTADVFSLGEFSLPDDFSRKEAPAGAEPLKSAAGQEAAGLAGATGADSWSPVPAPPFSPAGDAKTQPAKETPLDFAFGPKSAATGAPEEVGDEEELPPLSISSRRKGRSLLTVSIVAVSVLVILALSGAGIYLLKSGPAAFEKLDKVGLGFAAKWFGMESVEEGRITIRNPLAAFHQNKEAGEIFVVTGEAVNAYRKARASIHVKVSLFDKSGKVLMQKTAYCGNRLSNEQLATLPLVKIESIMNNQFGDSLSNLGVKPGQPIGFVVAMANVPKEAVDFGVEVVGSTVAGQ